MLNLQSNCIPINETPEKSVACGEYIVIEFLKKVSVNKLTFFVLLMNGQFGFEQVCNFGSPFEKIAAINII